jgi:ribosomal protein S18 acetylase RimI-like enzyme
MGELRAVMPEDWRLWREVRLAALTDAPDAFGSTLAYWSGDGDTERRWRKRLRDVPLNLVALVDGLPIGQVSGTAVGEDGRVELISMWVSPRQRGTGIANALVEAVAEWARGVGACEIRLSVRRGNDRAIRRYLRSGFVNVDEPGDEPAELAMVRRLQV